MNPLDFLKQKLQQGLSTVENWGSEAGNDVSHAVGSLFGANNAQPKSTQPTPGATPIQQAAAHVQPQQTNPIQLAQQQAQGPNTVKPMGFASQLEQTQAPAPAVKINSTPQPTVKPVKIAAPQPSQFVQGLTAGDLATPSKIQVAQPAAPPQKSTPAPAPTPVAKPSSRPVPAMNDNAGLTDALDNIDSYNQGDQVKVIQRASLSGVLPKNVAVSAIHEMLDPTPYRMPSVGEEIGTTAKNVAEQLLPGASQLSEQLGTDLAANDLFDQVKQGKMNYDDVYNAVNQSSNENGFDLNMKPYDAAAQAIKEGGVAATAAALTFAAPGITAGIDSLLTRAGLDVLLGPSASTVISHVVGAGLTGGTYNVSSLLASAAPQTWQSVAASFGQGALFGVVLGGPEGVQAAQSKAFDKFITSFPDAETFARENLEAAQKAGFKDATAADLINLYNDAKARVTGVPVDQSGAAKSAPVATQDTQTTPVEQPPEQAVETSSSKPEQLQAELAQPQGAGQTPSTENLSQRTETPETTGQQTGVGSSANNTTDVNNVNDGFPRRNADAERAALAEYDAGGTIKQATKEYMKYENVDSMTANRAVVNALQDAGHLPRGTDDVTALHKPLAVPDGLPDDVVDAAKALDEAYRENPKGGKDVSELTSQVRGRQSRFKELSAEFEKSLRRNFTPAERQAIRDNLEGAAKPGEVTPKVQAATDLARQLNDKALNIRALAKEDVGHVRQYATRIAARGRSTGNAIRVGKPKDIFDTSSRYSNSRVVRKYVSADGEARYGSLKDAGLRRNQDGELVAGNKVFHPTSVSTRELNENGFNYANDYGSIAKSYHADTGGLKARYDALQQLLKNADEYQLRSIEDAQPGDVEISGVPELQGMFAPRGVVSEIERTFKAADRRGAAEMGFNALSSGVINQVVLNPIFHTKNLLQLALEGSGKIPLQAGGRLESGPFGMFKLTAELVRLAKDSEYRHDMLMDYLSNGRLPDYGAHMETALTRAADELGVPHVSKMSSVAMEKIDSSLRLSLYGSLRRAGVEGGSAIKIVDQFLGDTRNAGRIEQNFGMFWNYFRTKARTSVGLAVHPIKNSGAAINLAITGAMLLAAQKAFRDWTHNPHGSIGAPGSLGFIKELSDIFGEVKSGQASRVASHVVNNINPLVTEGVNQATATDMYSGKRLNTVQDRLENLKDTLLPATQYSSKVANGQASTGEEILKAGLGVTLPHVKGAPAIPDTNNPLASFVNTPKASPAKGADPTGIDQATQYYTAKDKMTNSLQDDQVALDAANQYVDKDRDGNGKTILNNQYEQAQDDGKLASNPKALQAVQDFQKSLPDHNPMWDLPADKLRVYLSYKNMVPGDPNQVVIEQKNPWLADQFAKETAWGSKLQLSDNAVRGPGYVPYPNLSSSQQDMITQVSQLGGTQNRTPDQERQLQNLEANPDLQAAFGLLNKYTNDRRALWPGVQPIPYPSSSLNPQQEQMLQQEASLPKGTRAAFIRANQDSWNQIQQVLAENTVYNVERYGGIIQQGGSEPSFLKDVYNAGKYDIAPVQQSDGSTKYEVNPSLAYQIARSSGGAGGSGSAKKPLVPLPKRPKKNVARVLRIKKSRTSHNVHISKQPRIHIKKSQVLKPVHIGHGGPLKIANK